MLVAVGVLQACGTAMQPETAGSVSVDVEGQWSGTSVASCIAFQTPSGRCNAQQKVTFDFVRIGSAIKGSYSCAYGNMVCRNGNDSGRIDEVNASETDFTLIRVQLPDGTSCFYKGVFDKSQVKGLYSCYGGAAIIEQGSWRASRDF